MVFSDGGVLNVRSPVHPVNAHDPMLVSEFGNDTDESDVQLRNASEPMLCNVPENDTEASEVQ